MVVRKVHRKSRRAFNTEGEAHFVTFSCFQRRPFLSRDRTREYFIAGLERMRRLHHVNIWAYVIMPEHVHLLIYPVYADYDMEKMLATVKLSVSRRALGYLRKHNPAGLRQLSTGQVHTPYRFWLAGGGYDRNTVSFRALKHMIEYTHNNPVRRGLALDAVAWKWSSAQEWAVEGSGPLRLDRDTLPPLK